MMQCVLSGILNCLGEADIAKVAERMAERRRLAAQKGAATRQVRREDAEAQLAMRLVYLAWNKPRGKPA